MVKPPTLVLALATVLLAAAGLRAEPDSAFVRVSPRDSHYFELSDGRPYIPIGLNLIHPDTADREGLARMEQWLQRLGTNGGNFVRIWLSAPFWSASTFPRCPAAGRTAWRSSRGASVRSGILDAGGWVWMLGLNLAWDLVLGQGWWRAIRRS